MILKICIAAVMTCSASLLFAAGDEAASFRAGCKKLVEQTGEEVMTIKGQDNWLFLGNELRHIGAGKFWGGEAGLASQADGDDKKDPLPVILDFKKQLDDLGIKLILVPVPPKAFVYPEKLPDGSNQKASPRLDLFHKEFYDILAEGGIATIDLLPAFVKARDALQMYCRSDSHWSGAGASEAARLTADLIKKMDWYESAEKQEFESAVKSIEIAGDLGADLPEGDAARKEKMELRFISKDGSAIEEDPLSPVLVMADSHGLVFGAGGDMHALGAGFVDQLAYELKLRPALIAVRGSGATPTRVALYRKVKADAGYLASKKVVIWLFTAREFTETSGWTKLPVSP